jgi:hypothetical protein
LILPLFSSQASRFLEAILDILQEKSGEAWGEKSGESELERLC